MMPLELSITLLEWCHKLEHRSGGTIDDSRGVNNDHSRVTILKNIVIVNDSSKVVN